MSIYSSSPRHQYAPRSPIQDLELAPITEKHLRKRRQVRSRFKKQASPATPIFNTLLIAAMVVILLQGVRALVSGLHKLSTLVQSQAVVAQYHQATVQENQILKDKIRVYSSPAGIEEMARNYLNMVGRQEILVRLQ